MKKISIMMAMAAVALGFASCSEDRDPVYKAPTSFVLNIPSMENQYIDLANGNTLELVCSQPDYGYSAVADYSAEMSLTEDFADVYELIPIDNHQSRMMFKQGDVALGMCSLLGIENEDDIASKLPEGWQYEKVYFRAICQLNGVEGSRIVSNTVAYNYIKAYLAVQMPGYIYLVGDPNGWNINAGPEWRLYETVIGSKIYSGVFEVGAGSQYFRFYTEIGNWGDDGQLPSIGANPVDGDSNEVVWEDGSFTQKAVPGKGSWFTPADWEGGEITMVVDLSSSDNWTVTFTQGAVEVVTPMYIYLIGSIAGGWIAPDEANAADLEQYRLVSMDEGHIYTGSFPAEAGDIYFRFYTALTGWDGGDSIGIQEEDNSILCSFTNGEFSGPFVTGKGSWQFTLDEPATIGMTVDMDNQTVSYVLK